jgi:glycosyltransferase involved in cell wall biosynthesis
MRILFLTPQLPYPTVSGGLFKTFKMLEHLSSKHDVTFGCFLKENDSSYLEEFLKKFKLSSHFSLSINKERNALNYLMSLLRGIPLSVYRNQSEKFQSWVNEQARESEVLIIDHFLMFQYVPAWFKGKVIFHQHNAEYVMWSRFADENKGLKKCIINFESSRIRTYEQNAVARSSAVFAAPNDIEELKKIAPTGTFKVTYHLGDDSLLNEPYICFNERSNELLYIGTLTWEANRNGLHWFLDRMWENLINKRPDLKLVIIGKRNEGDFDKWMHHPSINWHGFVDDLNPYYSRAKVFIAPLKFGSGIKVKNINAMYRGLPLVTTNIGIEGLTIQNDIHVSVANTESEYVEAVIKLIEIEDHWKKIAEQSRNYAQANFSWNTILNDLEQEVLK